MNDEAAFQSWLDAHPDDHLARCVFADWLDERDDPRGPGYRALGIQQHKPQRWKQHTWNELVGRWNKRRKTVWYWMETITGTGYGAVLKSWWYWRLSEKMFPTRRAAEDAAALAFSRLPPARQAELLAPAPVGASS